MTSRGWRGGIAACACIFSFLLAGCGSGGGGGGSDEDGGGGDHGPLAEFMGWGQEADITPEIDQEERQRQYRVEELVADCMADEGFEYIPQRYDEGDFGAPSEYEEIWKLQVEDPEEFARQYGYGMTTMPEIEEPPSEEPDDPNWEIREGLSPAAQEEYDKALYGDWSEVEEAELEATGAPVEPENPGCYDQANTEVYGSPEEGESEDDRFQDLYEEMGALYERIENDSRLTAAKRAWSDCMAQAGYADLKEVFDGQELVNQRMSELYGWEDEWAESAAPEGEGDEPAEFETPPPPDPAAVAELQEYERGVALADFVCQRDHYESAHREVRDEIENEFIEDNRSELEALRDWENSQGVNG